MAKHKSTKSTVTHESSEGRGTHLKPESSINSSTASTKVKKSKKPNAQDASESNGTKKKDQTSPSSSVAKPQLPPLVFPTTMESGTETSESNTAAMEQDSAAQEAFVQAYLRQMVAEFGDDIDAVRSAPDFLARPDDALEILVDALKMGAERVPPELRVVPKQVKEM